MSETTPTDAARQLLQSSGSVVGGYGGYGGGSPPGGGYGGYSHLAYTGRYGGYGRSLAEDEDGVQLQPSDPVLEYTEQQQARADSQQMAAQQAAGGVSAAAVAALSAQHSSSSSRRHSSQLASIPAGLCYCRYDMDFHTWALGEDDCKSALYARCQVRSAAAAARHVRLATSLQQQSRISMNPANYHALKSLCGAAHPKNLSFLLSCLHVRHPYQQQQCPDTNHPAARMCVCCCLIVSLLFNDISWTQTCPAPGLTTSTRQLPVALATCCHMRPVSQPLCTRTAAPSHHVHAPA